MLPVVLGLSACGPTIIVPEGDDTTDTDAPPPPPSQSTTTPVPVPPGPGPDDDGPDSTSGSSDDGVTTEPRPPIPDFGGPACMPLGGQCLGPSDCCEGQCFVLQGPFGGVCSECDADEDCEYGCEDGWPLDFLPAICGNGQIGSSCETSDACVPGLVCAPFIQMPGVLETNVCSECIEDDDCPSGLHCAPQYAPSVFVGFRACVGPMSQPMGGGCLGDEECAEGRCAEALLRGLVAVTVCSECTVDADCDSGRCIQPEVIVDGGGVHLEQGYCA